MISFSQILMTTEIVSKHMGVFFYDNGEEVFLHASYVIPTSKTEQ